MTNYNVKNRDWSPIKRTRSRTWEAMSESDRIEFDRAMATPTPLDALARRAQRKVIIPSPGYCDDVRYTVCRMDGVLQAKAPDLLRLPLAERINPESVKLLMVDLVERESARSCADHADHLRSLLIRLKRGVDTTWLNKVKRDLKAKRTPRELQIGAAAVHELGQELIEGARALPILAAKPTLQRAHDRDRAREFMRGLMLIMLIQFPLRVGDFRLLNLQTSLKIEGDHSTITLRQEKTGEIYDAIIQSETHNLMVEYIEDHRHRLFTGNNEYFFPGRRSEARAYITIYKDIQETTSSLVAGGLSPHDFRRLATDAAVDKPALG